MNREVIFKDKRNLKILRNVGLFVTFPLVVVAFEGVRAGITRYFFGSTPKLLGFVKTSEIASEKGGLFVLVLSLIFFLIIAFYFFKVLLKGYTTRIEADSHSIYVIRNGLINNEIPVEKSSIIRIRKKQEFGKSKGMNARSFRFYLDLKTENGKERKFLFHRMPDKPIKQGKRLMKAVRQAILQKKRRE